MKKQERCSLSGQSTWLFLINTVRFPEIRCWLLRNITKKCALRTQMGDTANCVLCDAHADIANRRGRGGTRDPRDARKLRNKGRSDCGGAKYSKLKRPKLVLSRWQNVRSYLECNVYSRLHYFNIKYVKNLGIYLKWLSSGNFSWHKFI